ncbi:Imm21 family immunity protein [Hymenobacter puniceus]|uniref:Imm21 family immunity protein n=1 Tax=Hymenobacter sp. BT190 TaxID=2763505 RepID=UPI00165162A8|nr:Imm21 family immunity protein [Hymenobacter sp. BT190]MBC6698409.1 hypothetical protein [Hymenobacter sp. BT190]
MAAELNWITAVNSGVPLLLCPAELAPLWEEIDHPTNGRVVKSTFRFSSESGVATDYDRACEVAKDYAQTISIGEGHALLLGDEIPFATWIASESFIGGYIVIPYTFSDEEPDYSIIAKEIPSTEFSDTFIHITASESGLVLFPSTDKVKGEDSLEIECLPGSYTISIAFHITDDIEIRIFKVEQVAT